MKTQKFLNLNQLYNREEDFSEKLSKHLNILNVGIFEDVETEANVGTRKADIYAQGESGKLVIEVQFGKADWDHWGRLEAYARLKEANVAVFLAEKFEELMKVTCNLRNEDSIIDWYLIQIKVNEHKEFSINHVVSPSIDIQTEKKDIEYSEFWATIRSEGLFRGKPVPKRDEAWISKGVKGATIVLLVNKRKTQVDVDFRGEDRKEKRDKAYEILKELDHEIIKKDTPKFSRIVFPIIDKGRADYEYWDEIRDKIVKVGTEIYNTL